jgi:hypothetical protein
MTMPFLNLESRIAEYFVDDQFVILYKDTARVYDFNKNESEVLSIFEVSGIPVKIGNSWIVFNSKGVDIYDDVLKLQNTIAVPNGIDVQEYHELFIVEDYLCFVRRNFIYVYDVSVKMEPKFLGRYAGKNQNPPVNIIAIGNEIYAYWWDEIVQLDMSNIAKEKSKLNIDANIRDILELNGNIYLVGQVAGRNGFWQFKDKLLPDDSDFLTEGYYGDLSKNPGDIVLAKNLRDPFYYTINTDQPRTLEVIAPSEKQEYFRQSSLGIYFVQGQILDSMKLVLIDSESGSVLYRDFPYYGYNSTLIDSPNYFGFVTNSAFVFVNKSDLSISSLSDYDLLERRSQRFEFSDLVFYNGYWIGALGYELIIFTVSENKIAIVNRIPDVELFTIQAVGDTLIGNGRRSYTLYDISDIEDVKVSYSVQDFGNNVKSFIHSENEFLLYVSRQFLKSITYRDGVVSVGNEVSADQIRDINIVQNGLVLDLVGDNAFSFSDGEISSIDFPKSIRSDYAFPLGNSNRIIEFESKLSLIGKLYDISEPTKVDYLDDIELPYTTIFTTSGGSAIYATYLGAALKIFTLEIRE